MKDWYEYANNKIKEYLLITHLISYLIYGATFFIIFNTSLNSFNSFTLLVSLLGLVFLCLLLVRSKDRFPPNQQPDLFTIFLCLFNIVVISIIVLFSESKVLNLRYLYFIPVILAALNNNKVYRYVVTLACGLGIMTINYINLKNLRIVPLTFDSDILLVGIFFLAGWLIGGLRDIEIETQQHLQNLAHYDDLTGLANHRYFQEILDSELEKAAGNMDSLSLIMADIDFFKFYNDTYGHQYGDEVLKQVGQILMEKATGIGIAARYGGEEFAIILPALTQQQAALVADTISQKISTFGFYGAETQPKGKLTISCGVAAYPVSAKNKKELIRAADQALYKAKSASKNRIELYFNILDEICVTKTEQSLLSSIKTLISIINAKDRYTYGHSERVALYARQLAQKIGLDEDALKRLSLAAFLHDIGKIEIQRDVLNKTSPLTSEERNILCNHPVWGAEIILPIKDLKDISTIILYHHENYDGSGYPHHIKGAQIPLEARIIRIVDSFDAMTTNRPYKTALLVPEALEELDQFAGSYFDPILVKHFIQLCKEGKIICSTA